MFSKGIPIFLLVNIIICDLSKSSLIQNPIKLPLVYNNLSNNNSKNPTTAKTELLILKSNNSIYPRGKRGIVLIDEDFDTLPDLSVRQSWSGENIASDVTDAFKSGEKISSDLTDNFKESKKDSQTDEGSGSTLAQDSTFNFSITPEKLQITQEKSKLTTFFDTTLEGSGDDVFTPKPTKSDEIVIKDNLFVRCSNVTCNSHEIQISPGFAESLSEDSTLILTCSMTNFSSGDFLQWYKSNGSDSYHLEASVVKDQLQFAMPKVKLEDSGQYVCVRASEQSCCHMQLDVTVYKKPNYKFHLLIVGLVAAVSLLICLLLGIHRKYQLKKYKKQLNTQIPLNEFLL